MIGLNKFQFGPGQHLAPYKQPTNLLPLNQPPFQNKTAELQNGKRSNCQRSIMAMALRPNIANKMAALLKHARGNKTPKLIVSNEYST